MTISFKLLSELTHVQEFDCGNEELNLFLTKLALLFQRRHFGVTVIGSDNEGKVIGYYTLCPACIQRQDLPEKTFTGPRPNPIPAFRLCRLAIDKDSQCKGYGKLLFVHALKKCVEQAKQIGGSLVLIDAKNEHVVQFYKHFGFIPVINNPLLLFQTIKYIDHHLDDRA